MKKLRKSEGITLVALVITIIILLILAGLSILALTGSGLFGKAEDAVEKYGNAQNRENLELSKYEDYINGYINGTRDTITIDKTEYEKMKNTLNTVTAKLQELEENYNKEQYGYDENSKFYYQIFSNNICILWQNYTASSSVNQVKLDFPFEFEVPPSASITKTTENTNNNNIVIRGCECTQMYIDTNYGSQNKCSFSIIVIGKLK